MRRLFALVAAALALTVVPVLPGGGASTAAAAPSDVIAVVIEGTGNGHGRGLSQWGAYGRAVEGGQNWVQILDAYYSNTVMGDVDVNGQMSVRLVGLAGQSSIALTSWGSGVTWNGQTFASMRAVRNGSTFDVYSSTDHTCLANTFLANVPQGGVTFTTAGGDNPGLAAGSTLGVCRPDGTVVHYRGAIGVGLPDGVQVVNSLRVEDYLRGVVPREVPASWADAGGGAGINALRAQAVAARSYALAGTHRPWAKTCDTPACQVYGGAATRVSAGAANATVREDARSNRAVLDTAGKVRKWPSDGRIVSTEFSASNGPRTAGGDFPVINDPLDATANNPNHKWTRVLTADQVASRYGLGRLTAATMVESSNPSYQRFDGIWFNDVLLNAGQRVDAWTFRNDFGLPSPGFTVRVVTRDTTTRTVAMIGDSVLGSVSAAGGDLGKVTNGTFTSLKIDAAANRCTTTTCSGATSGLRAAAAVPLGTDLVVVELGYNDPPATFGTTIDRMMTALQTRGVGQVAWVNMAEVRTSGGAPVFAPSNAALRAARTRWPNLFVLDWNRAIPVPERSRWLSDGVQLTTTGRAAFSLWLRGQMLNVAPIARLRPPRRIEIPIVGQTYVDPNGVPGVVPAGAAAAALNVVVVDPNPAGFVTVWPCGRPMPLTSNLNYAAHDVVGNGVIAPVGANGKACLYSSQSTDVVVDITGWIAAGTATTPGFAAATPLRVVDTRNGTGAPLSPVRPASPIPIQIVGRSMRRADGTSATVPASATAVAINVTSVLPASDGFVTVWPCGTARPLTSSLNYSRGKIEGNGVIARVGADGRICLHVHSPVNVVVDVMGWFTAGTGSVTSAPFVAAVPERFADSRVGLGVAAGPVRPASPIAIQVTGRQMTVGGQRLTIPAGTAAVALNLTAVTPRRGGFATVWPCGADRPFTSSLNYTAGTIKSNNMVAPLSADGKICIYTLTDSNYVVDVTGWFTGGATQGFFGSTPKRLVDTRFGVGPIPI